MKIPRPESMEIPSIRRQNNGTIIFPMSLRHRDFLRYRNTIFGLQEGYLRKGIKVETRVALIGIIVEDMEAAERINTLLHEYSQYVIGRMGLPYREKNISIISVVVNAEADVISTLAGKLGMIKGVNVKTVYSKK